MSDTVARRTGRFADVAVERHEGTRHQAIRMQRPDSGLSFFERLFR